jgi:hypothetical protein
MPRASISTASSAPCHCAAPSWKACATSCAKGPTRGRATASFPVPRCCCWWPWGAGRSPIARLHPALGPVSNPKTTRRAGLAVPPRRHFAPRAERFRALPPAVQSRSPWLCRHAHRLVGRRPRHPATRTRRGWQIRPRPGRQGGDGRQNRQEKVQGQRRETMRPLHCPGPLSEPR